MGTKPIGVADLDARIIGREAKDTVGITHANFTTTQRDAIVAPATGLTIMNTTTGKINFWDGAAWRVVTST